MNPKTFREQCESLSQFYREDAAWMAKMLVEVRALRVQTDDLLRRQAARHRAGRLGAVARIEEESS